MDIWAHTKQLLGSLKIFGNIGLMQNTPFPGGS